MTETGIFIFGMFVFGVAMGASLIAAIGTSADSMRVARNEKSVADPASRAVNQTL